MINRAHELPLVRQAELLLLSRSSLYYNPRPVSLVDLAIMRRIDELHLAHPFAGSRMLRDLLRGEGVALTTPLIFSVPHLVPIRADSLPGVRVFWDEWTAWTWKRRTCAMVDD